MTMIHQNEARIEEVEEDDAGLFSAGQLIPGLNPIEHGAGEKNQHVRDEH